MIKLPQKEKSQVVSLYLEGISTVKLGKRFGITPTAVWGILKRRGTLIREMSEASRRFALRQDAFATVTPEAAYWVGFLMADGTISGRQIACTVSECDMGHLEKLRDFLGYGGEIIRIPGGDLGKYKRKATVRLAVSSARLVKDLNRFGIVPRKTHTACVNLLESDRHFWRGVVDGDGWIKQVQLSGTGNQPLPGLSLVGSFSLLTQFQAWAQALGVACNVNAHKSIFRVDILGRNAWTLLRELYRDCSVALCRKTQRVQEALKWQYIDVLRGEKHPGSKLSDAQRLSIQQSKLSSRKLAKQYNVAASTIKRLKSNSGFAIAQRGLKTLSDGSSSGLSVSELRPIGVAQAETIGASHARK